MNNLLDLRETIVPDKGLWQRFLPRRDARTNGWRIAVVGGGPGGLLVTWKLLDLGHNVLLLERGDPYGASREDDARSFNLTADGLGMYAFGKLRALVYYAGTIVDGRAIHRPRRPVFTHWYGRRPSDHLVSIARGDLLALFAATITNHPECRLLFNAEATDANVDAGSVTWNQSIKDAAGRATTTESSESFDLVVFADGIHGLGQSLAKARVGPKYAAVTHEIPYLKVTIRPDGVQQQQLPLDKINFFPAGSCLAIGLPNHDGSISTLIEDPIRTVDGQAVSPFTQKPFSWYAPVFESEVAAAHYVATLNPRLLPAVPDLAAQLTGQRPGHFHTTSINTWRIGDKGVLLGEAGGCAPPWAGFGMNLACSHAHDLADFIDRSSSLGDALSSYDQRRVRTNPVIQRIVAQHGVLLASAIGSWRWRIGQASRDWGERLFGRRTPYQIVAFEEKGLHRLAES